jgi:hypothetical protein
LPWWRQLAAACVIGGLLAGSGAVGSALVTVTRNLASASASGNPAEGPTSTSSAPAIASPPALPGPLSGPLQVTKVYTYQQGTMVFVEIYYTDRDNSADGFGFMGVDGSPIAAVTYPFFSPGDGIVETGSIRYPFNEGCGTGQHRSDFIEVWVTAAGKRSPRSAPVRLACAA